MSMVKSKKFQAALSWGISLALLIWIGSGLEWGKLSHVLKETNYLYLIPLTLVLFFHYLVRAFRWRYLLPGDAPTPGMKTLFDSLMIGNMASYVLPLRAGEFVRPFLLTKDTGQPFVVTFSSVVIERFFDLATVLLILACISSSLPTLPSWAMSGALGLAILGGGIFVFMLLSAFCPTFILRLVEIGLRFIPESLRGKIKNLIDGLMKGAAVLKDPKRLVMSVVLSSVVWTTVWLSFLVGLYMFPDVASGFLAITLTVVVALAVAAPSAPGFIGVFQTGCVAAFALLGLPSEVAFGYSLIIHAHQFLFIVLYGVYALGQRKLTLKGLVRNQQA
jgi:uncharacterized protein (TIRG00374 family)